MAQYRRIPTNQNLIKGAGFAASGATNTGGFVDSSAVIDKSFAKAEKRIKEQEAKAEAAAKKKAAEAEKIEARNRAEFNQQKNKMASLQSQLRSNVDTTGLSSAGNLNAVKDFVVDKRNKYVEIASELSKMSPFDDKYAELTSELNNVQTSIVNLAGDLKKYNTQQTKFIGDFNTFFVTYGDKDKIESTKTFFDPNNVLSISDNGDASFGNVSVKSYELPSYAQRDPATLVNDAVAKRVRSAKPLTPTDRAPFRDYLLDVIKDKNTVKSLLNDGYLGENVLKDIKAYKAANPDVDDTTAFIEGTLNNVERLSQAAYDVVQREKNSKSGGKPSSASSTEERIAAAKNSWDKKGVINLKNNMLLQYVPQNEKYQLMFFDKGVVSPVKDNDGKEITFDPENFESVKSFF